MSSACKGLCEHEPQQVKNRETQKYCSKCSKYIVTEILRCYCCKNLTRNKNLVEIEKKKEIELQTLNNNAGDIFYNIEYSGFIFFGLISVKGDPFVIEYNCRLGDPETEVILPRLKSDLLDLFDGIASDTLSERDVVIDPRSASTVMLVSGGYPEKYEKGKKVSIGDIHQKSIVFHAGTKHDEGTTVTNGGRVMSVTSYGKDIESSLKVSYESIENISFDKMYFRKDIGQDLVKKN